MEKLKLKKRRDELAMSLTAATRKKAALGVIKNVMEVRVIIIRVAPEMFCIVTSTCAFDDPRNFDNLSFMLL